MGRTNQVKKRMLIERDFTVYNRRYRNVYRCRDCGHITRNARKCRNCGGKAIRPRSVDFHNKG